MLFSFSVVLWFGEWRYRSADDVLWFLQIRRAGEATTSECKRTKYRTKYQSRHVQITCKDMDDTEAGMIGRNAGVRRIGFRPRGSGVTHGGLYCQLVTVVPISMVVRVTQRLDHRGESSGVPRVASFAVGWIVDVAGLESVSRCRHSTRKADGFYLVCIYIQSVSSRAPEHQRQALQQAG
jgi:hypothetical protein